MSRSFTLSDPVSFDQLALLPQHRQLLLDSGISLEVALARGYRTVEKKAELNRLGFGEKQCRVPALLIPVHGVHGEIALYQARPDEPRIDKRGRAVKYETLRDCSMVLDVPPLARSMLGDPAVPLIITEGVRKADSAVSRGLCCVALLGVWNFRGTNKLGGKTALPDWEHIALNDRQVYICFDSDVMTKPQVHEAMKRLAELLRLRGAHVAFIYLPAGDAGRKTGLDDYLAAGHSWDDALRLASPELHSLPVAGAGDGEYFETDAGLFWRKQAGDSYQEVLLANFSARITAQIVEDDGAESRRLLEVSALCQGRKHTFRLPAEKFVSMNWPIEEIGVNAILQLGVGVKDRARVAIQSLSDGVEERHIYTHTGWREVHGKCVYLHAHGAIGEDGFVEGVEVDLHPSLAAYTLPEPPSDSDTVDAIRSSLGFLGLAPATITVPLYAAIWAAPVVQSDLSVHLTGPSGTGKSALAALIQQHYGPDMDARRLPCSWSSTANALEGLAFLAKDAVLVVDDFAPTGTTMDIARMHRDADRLLRAQGNRSGRQRMSADAGIRETKPPRGLILSTGEDVPKGESLRARIVVVEMSPDALDMSLLTRCQMEAAAGLHARALSAYLKWLAPRYKSIQSALTGLLEQMRGSMELGCKHRRTPDNFAKLALALSLFLDFAADTGAITATERSKFWQKWLLALRDTARMQAQHQTASDPVLRFVSLIRAAISSGEAHIAGENGQNPCNAGAWGWRQRTTGTGDNTDDVWEPKGQRIGWLVDQDLYLEPDSSYRAAQRIAGDVGEAMPITSRTLHKRLQDSRLLASTNAERGTLTVRRTLEGARRYVLHLRAATIMPQETTQSAQTDRPGVSGEKDERQDGQFAGQVGGGGESETAPRNCPVTPRAGLERGPVGRSGSLGSSPIPREAIGVLEGR